MKAVRRIALILALVAVMTFGAMPFSAQEDVETQVTAAADAGEFDPENRPAPFISSKEEIISGTDEEAQGIYEESGMTDIAPAEKNGGFGRIAGIMLGVAALFAVMYVTAVIMNKVHEKKNGGSKN
ncbi:MAG: hypothetical protein IJP17_06845 [Clostridia bacterium]|nr:hypothetical protein [Clostridia bacterium]